MKRRAAAAFVVAIACVAACGGRVDGGVGSSGSSTSTGTSGGATGNPGLPPSGAGKPGRPPIAPMTNAGVASAIAEDYCKAFSSCCVGDGQPPIDVSRCRALASAAVEKQLDAAGTTESSGKDVAVCVAAIHTRIAACGPDDIHWPGPDPAFFAPASIATACLPLLPNVKVPPAEPCGDSMTCHQEPGSTCAIDMCTSAGLIGLGCPAGECVDSARCVEGFCASLSTADVNARCSTNDDCRLGLVCFAGACAPAREHPELNAQRSSPYRIGSDTCRAYSYL